MNRLARQAPLDVAKPRTERERTEEILTKVDPAWMERFKEDLPLAADFYQKHAPESWAKAEQEIGL